MVIAVTVTNVRDHGKGERFLLERLAADRPDAVRMRTPEKQNRVGLAGKAALMRPPRFGTESTGLD